MIGNLYRRSSNKGSDHSGNKLESAGFKSPFMYMRDTSCRTMELSLDTCEMSGSDTTCSFGEDIAVDTSQVSFVVDDDDDLDELEKALEIFAAKEERQAAKEKQREEKKDARRRRCSTGDAPRNTSNSGSRRQPLRKTQTMPDQEQGRPVQLLQRKDSNKSIGSNKSLPLSALVAPPTDSDPIRRGGRRSSSSGLSKTKTLSSSNRSLMSLCPPKDQLHNIFGPTDFSSFNWDGYFQELCAQDMAGGTIMDSELERAIASGKVKRLQRLHRKGVSMNARNKQGETVAHLVCREGNAEMLIYLIQEANVSVRVRDHSNKTPLHEVAWSPTFNPSVAMMLMSDSPELLWAPDSRGFLALDYVPKRTMIDWYDFLEVKQPMLKLALQFSRFKASSAELNSNQERLRKILEQQVKPDNPSSHSRS